jgi:peptide/nickel transport system substrate-binding protein
MEVMKLLNSHNNKNNNNNNNNKGISIGVLDVKCIYPDHMTRVLGLSLVSAIIIAFFITITMSTGASAATGNSIVSLEVGHMSSMDYQTDNAYDTSSFEITQNVYETLFYFNGNDTNTPVGVLATGYNVSSDGLTYTIYLRTGVKFHDGTDFNASAVKYSLDRLLLIDNGEAYSDFPGTVKGYSAYDANSATTTQADIDAYNAAGGIKVINDTCVQITLDSPHADFIKLLTFPATSIMSPTFDIAHGGYNATGHVGNVYMQDHEAGTGPFLLGQSFNGSEVILVKNTHYWRSPAWADTVVIREVDDYNERLSALKNGSADFIVPSGYNPEDYNDPGITVETGNATLLVSAIGMNYNISPFNNTLVREAFAESFNTTQYNQYLSNSYGPSLNGPIPNSLEGYNPAIPGYQFNPSHAKVLLIAAGYSSSKPVTITYYYNMGNTNRLKIGQMLKQQIEGYNIGLTIDIQEVDFSNYINMMFNEQLPLYSMGWIADYPSADNFIYAYAYSYGYYASMENYHNTSVDTAYDQLLTQTDPGVRQQLYDTIVLGLKADYAYIWTTGGTEFQPHKSNIKGYTFNAMDCGIRYYSISREAPDTLNANYVSDTIPATMVMGQNYNVSVTFDNTGTLPWSESDLDRMLVWGDTTALGMNSNCDNHGCGYPEYAIQSGTTVLPGQSYTFYFEMTPSSTGSYMVGMIMAQNGANTSVAGYGSANYRSITVSPSVFNESLASASLVSVNIPTTLMLGHTYNGSITFMNTGPEAWNEYSLVRMLVWGSTAELGIHGDAYNYGCGYEEFKLPTGTTIQPGGTYTWSFSFTPISAGYTCIGLIMAHNKVDGTVLGFGQPDFKSIIVTPASFDIAYGNSWYLGNTVPTSMVVGHTYNVSVTYMNDGWAPWSETDNVRLLAFGDTTLSGLAGDCDNYGSGYPEYAIHNGEYVLLWQTHTYNFTMTPTTPGTYMVGFAIIQNTGSTVTPFGGYGYATVNVTQGVTTLTPGVLSIVTDATYPPFESINSSTMAVEGFDIDLMNEIAEELGLNVVYTDRPFDTIIASVAANSYDCSISAFTITPERQTIIDFSDPYYENRGEALVVKPGHDNITRIEDLANMTIGVQAETLAQSEVMGITGIDPVNVKSYTGTSDAMAALKKGEVNVVAGDYVVLKPYVDNYPADYQFSGTSLSSSEYFGIIASKDNPGLAVAINKTLANIKADGRYDTIYEKWF